MLAVGTEFAVLPKSAAVVPESYPPALVLQVYLPRVAVHQQEWLQLGLPLLGPLLAARVARLEEAAARGRGEAGPLHPHRLRLAAKVPYYLDPSHLSVLYLLWELHVAFRITTTDTKIKHK
ncbi:MAG: hypothetical protein GY703_20785 [Gammaproteobacteria bacterium]|nr:hypothetical protein [Gammaproteobacteria bacterium]